MPKRLPILAALCVALVAFVLPSASASAASPWWQLLDGSRPSHLWEGSDSVQEVSSKAEKREVEPGVSFEGTAIGLKAHGELIACLWDETPLGGFGCAVLFGGLPMVNNAVQLKELLDTVYGTSEVEVTGGPVSSAPFVITVPGRGVSPVELVQGNPEKAVGTGKVKILSPGGSGGLVITATNLGDASVDGSSEPVVIRDQLPEGMIATGAEAKGESIQGIAQPVKCEVEAPDEVVCTFEGELRPYAAIEAEVFVTLTGTPPVQGGPGRITVTGGGAQSASIPQNVIISPDPVPFGIERFSAQSEEEGGAVAKRAGSHPFQFTTTVQLNAGRHVGDVIEQPALPRNLRFPLPAGLVGNVTPMPRCAISDFLTHDPTRNEVFNDKCDAEAAIGVAAVTFNAPGTLGFLRQRVPVFNLPPAQGEPARFGIMPGGDPIVIDTAFDPDTHRITALVRNATEAAQLISSTLSIWGYPGDPRHDNARGWECTFVEDIGPCQRPTGLPDVALMRQPVSCNAPLDFGVEAEPWNVPLGSVVTSGTYTGEPQIGCANVPFDPDIASAPSSKLAENPSGLEFQLDMPDSGLLNPKSIAEGQAKKVVVTLPKGMTINPSQGEGLVGCSPADLARETFSSPPGAGCPDASKIGEVQISTPLLSEEARGSLFVASPYDNPFGSLLALYMVAKVPERGILIRQAGKVETDPVTGQITTTFDDLPQLPFTSFNLRFRPGGRAPLVTPTACGNYDIVAQFTPWSAQDPDNPAPNEVVTRTSSFSVDRGVDGGACPSGGVPPFHPGLLAGTTNNAAGHYSPFNVRLTRNDGEQEFTNFSIKLPPGVIGKLAGIPFCPDAAIAAAKARTGANGGQEELDNPSCPAASQVGKTLVGAGVGSLLTYVPGKLYLAGPYHGSALSIVAITAAKVGPFDLGTVVIREALKVNPDTAEVFVDATGSDPIPHIIQGIPVHARDIRVYVDRSDFVLNPTSCERTSTASTVLGSGLDFGSSSDDQPVTVTSPFQAADCQALGFKPKLSLRLRGGTRRGATPALEAVLKARKGDANIAGAQVTLPHSEFLEQSHIRTICTRVQFNAGDVPGEKCPAGSVYGHARAITPLLDEPIEGPVYLRSSPRPLPDLVAALHSGKIDVNVVGYIDSVKGGRIRNTFATVPDAPVTKFVLKMQGGKKGLLVNSTNICKGKNRAIADFTGHNGKTDLFKPLVKGTSCKKAGRKGKRSHRHHG